MSHSKRVLILTPEIPYPVFKGNQNRIDQTIRMLIASGFKVALAILNQNQEGRKSVDIEQELSHEYSGIVKVAAIRHPKFSKLKEKPPLLFRWISPEGEISNLANCPKKYVKLVKRVCDEFKPTHIIVNYVKLTSAIPKGFRGASIVDTHDIQTHILSESIRAGFSKKPVDLEKFGKEEFELLGRYDYIVSINQNETLKIREKLPGSRILTIPAFMPTNPPRPDQNKHYDILFIGSASPFNAEGIKLFIRNSLPIIRKKLPGVRVAIAGDVSNVASVKALANPSIEYLGRVDDVSATYRASKVCVSPIVSGAGMKVKNIEALSFAMPIVATSFSMDGIEAVDGVHALIRDDWKGFAEAVIKLLGSKTARDQIAQNAHLLAKSRYSEEAALAKYKLILLKDYDFKLSPSLDIPAALQQPALALPGETRRTKALIYSTEAEYLIGYNIALANSLKEIGVYSEFIKMEPWRENRFLAEGYLMHATRPLITKEARKKIKDEVSGKIAAANGKLKLEYQGVDISNDIAIYKGMFPEHFEGKKEVDVITHAIAILQAILQRVRSVKPDFLVGWNGNGPHFIFLMKVAAKIAGIPIFHVERGLLPDTLVFDPQGVNYKSSISGSYLPLLKPDERSRAATYIDRFRRDAKTIVNTGATFSGSLIKEGRSPIPSGKQYIFFPLQIEGDSNIIINSPIYKKMDRAIQDIAAAAAKFGLYLLCRPHPENSEAPSTQLTDLPNVVFDNSQHLHEALQGAVANVVINSTVGLESLILGKPTICLGHSVYSGKGITYDAYHQEHIELHLASIVNGKHDNESKKALTEELVHLLFESCLIDLNETKNNSKVLFSNLLKNGIIASITMPPPKTPEKPLKYLSRLRDFQSAIESAKKINVYSAIEKETIQWLNGSKKPTVTMESIKNHLARKTKAAISIVQTDLESAIKAATSTVDSKENGKELSIAVINAKKIDKATCNSTYIIDEYFYLN